MTLGGIILAGGSSQRMGQDKALLPFGEKTLIEKLIDELSLATNDVIVVARDCKPYKFLPNRLIEDSLLTPSALSGIHAGLAASPFEKNFILACDLPFFDHRIVNLMAEYSFANEIVIAQSSAGYESLCGIYSKSLIPLILHSFEIQDFSIQSLYTKTRAFFMMAGALEGIFGKQIFFNMNTTEDYSAALGQMRNNSI